MKHLSIVIPVYNVEKYISKCLESIFEQNMSEEDLEIIIINDGSTDNSSLIIQEYSKIKNNIKVVNQHNQGLSIARNNGLNLASGKYLWFIDSDDWIESNCILELYNKCELLDLDILSFGHYIAFEKSKFIKGDNNSKFVEHIIKGNEILKENAFMMPVQFYIFKTEFLKMHDLKFYPGILHEDNEFTPRALYFSQKTYFWDTNVYYHLVRVGSITNIVNPKRCFDLIKIANLNCEFIKVNNIKGSERASIILNSFFCLTQVALIYRHLNERQIRRDILSRLRRENKIIISVLFTGKIQFKLEALIFYFSPKLFSISYTFFKKHISFLNKSRILIE